MNDINSSEAKLVLINLLVLVNSTREQSLSKQNAPANENVYLLYW
jgi:hypothetical protein